MIGQGGAAHIAGRVHKFHTYNESRGRRVDVSFLAKIFN
jgi:hypothetical protein